MEQGFWTQLKKPIIGLAPMDGVTDAAFRFIVDSYGAPSILMTEFTSVEGLTRGATQLLQAFVHHKTETPTIAQIFGTEVESFYKVAFVVCELGFDGIDINMGCPDVNVARRGGGAGLILTPKLAQEIVLATKKGVRDWAQGKKIGEIDLHKNIVKAVSEFQKKWAIVPVRRVLPVSVKTRIGYEKIVTEDWISQLLEVEPANISLHGRTLKELYSGRAHWDEIGKAAALIKKTKTLILGNGDVQNLDDAYAKIKEFGLDGVLIGRATFGNPWIFKNQVAPLKLRLNVALEQAQAFMEFTPKLHFLSVRKHLSWYCKGFEGAGEVRTKLMRANTAQDVEEIINHLDLPPQASS